MKSQVLALLRYVTGMTLLVAAGIAWAVPLSLAATLGGSAMPDDGTYRMTKVTTIKACNALCKADSQCRGVIADQADVTKPEIICRLNNGFGARPAFPSTPPAPFNQNIATADLNDYRRQHGLDPVILNDKLIAASRIHAKDLAAHNTISHSGSDGSSHSDRVQRQGYYFTIAAENVASGQKSWKKVFKAWQDSPGHNENLLLPEATEFGIALIYDPKSRYETYWAMIMATPLSDPQLRHYFAPVN